MPVAAEKPHLRAAKKTRDPFSEHVAANDDPDHREQVEGCAARIWRRYGRGTSHDLEDTHRHHHNQKRQADEHETDSGSLRPRCTAHNFSAASDADARALGNLRIAVRADEFFHIGNIAASGVSWEHFSRSVCRGDADARHHRCLSDRQHLVFLRRGADPLHGEVLEGHEQFAEIASRDFDFVIGEDKAQSFAFVRAGEGGGDEMLKREDVNFAASRFKAQAGG